MDTPVDRIAQEIFIRQIIQYDLPYDSPGMREKLEKAAANAYIAAQLFVAYGQQRTRRADA